MGHIPSKIFLQNPYSQDLSGVAACISWNNGFSKDKDHMACFLYCVIEGTTEHEKLTDQRVVKSLKRNKSLER